jgi:hypothetical protein
MVSQAPVAPNDEEALVENTTVTLEEFELTGAAVEVRDSINS